MRLGSRSAKARPGAHPRKSPADGRQGVTTLPDAGGVPAGCCVVGPFAVPDDGSAQDVLRSALERLYNVELRQEREEAEFKKTQKSLLDRVYDLEQRSDEAIDQQAEIDHSLLERLKNLEDRFFMLERTANGPTTQQPAGTPPASGSVVTP